MMPIAPLMIEHRLIEKMILLIRQESDKAQRKGGIDPEFVDLAVDFIRTYTDRCHHGKEEEIFFRDLRKKTLSGELERILDELIEEHRQGREVVSRIVEARGRYMRGDSEALQVILECMNFLADFYPKHIEKEDKHFFIPCMEYFSPGEQEAMLKEESAFDESLIHQIYKDKLSVAEKRSGLA